MKNAGNYSAGLTESLRAIAGIPRWVFWKYEPRKDNPAQMAKMLKNPHTGGNAKSNEPSTWADFDTAHEGYVQYKGNGFGFVLGGGFAGIDIDDCIDDNGQISDMAAKIIERMNSYTEKSPSKHGIHILCRVDDGFTLDGETGKNDRKRRLEIYCGGHYFTVTSNVYGEEKPIENRTQELLAVYREYFAKPQQERAKKQAENVLAGQNSKRITGNESDNELWQRMFDSEKGARILALYNGDISGYKTQSEADLALVTYLVYWTGHDAIRVDSMFRQSGLMRGKWDEPHDSAGQTYGQMTINKALATTPIYTPPVTYSQTRKQESSGAVLRPMTDFFNPETDSILGDDDSTPQAPVNAGSPDNEPHTVLTYLEKSLHSDLKQSQKYRYRKTGYSNIDKYNSLFPGLYVIGSVTGNGKTTFCGQIADYLASVGESVLYFSLEQTELELVTKGLARLTAQAWREKWLGTHREEIKTNPKANPFTGYGYGIDAMTAIEIRKGDDTLELRQAIAKYKTFAGNLRIIECGFNMDVDGIINTIKNFMASHDGVKPVVMVDYLQIVKPAKEAAKMAKRDSIDDTVQRFKKLSAENDLAVILISSLNRQNYLSVVDFESFKESGGIEYTADVVWGLQLLAMNAKIFDTDKSLQMKRKFVREQKNATPRLMELIGLKNRYGRAGTRYFFDYYPAYDLFVPFERDEDDIDDEMTQAFEIFKAQNESDSGSDSTGKRTKKIKDSK